MSSRSRSLKRIAPDVDPVPVRVMSGGSAGSSSRGASPADGAGGAAASSSSSAGGASEVYAASSRPSAADIARPFSSGAAAGAAGASSSGGAAGGADGGADAAAASFAGGAMGGGEAAGGGTEEMQPVDSRPTMLPAAAVEALRASQGTDPSLRRIKGMPPNAVVIPESVPWRIQIPRAQAEALARELVIATFFPFFLLPSNWLFKSGCIARIFDGVVVCRHDRAGGGDTPSVCIIDESFSVLFFPSPLLLSSLSTSVPGAESALCLP